MKRWIYYVILLVFCAGCNMDFLPETQITEENVLKDLNDVQRCFMEAYQAVQIRGGITGKIDLDKGLADDVMPNFAGRDVMLSFLNADAGKMYKDITLELMYADFYNSIAICNLTLEQLKKCEVTDSVLWRQLQGEALALRAYDHFSLVNYFGRPYYDHPETNPGIVLKMSYNLGEAPRSTVKVVYDTIIHDLKKARELMTLSDNLPSRFTADGVTALLCRVYLFMGKWDMVIEEADKLIGNYNLPSDPYGQFEAIDGEGEIFTLDFSYLGYGFYYPSGAPSEQMKSIFHDGDYRLNYVVEDGYWDWDEDGNDIWVSDGELWWKIGMTYKVLRIAEIYLNRAEAYCELGKYDLALADLIEVLPSRVRISSI